ncbi:MAG: transposase [Desulfobacterales bacterium]
MSRRARIDAPGALHHIVIRGIERKAIFKEDTDREDFVERLSSLLQETVTPCYDWALMTNHVHLLLRTGTVPIASIIRRLLTGYAVRFNPAFSGTIAGTDIFFRIATNRFFVRRIGISSSWSHTLWNSACK